MRRPRGQAHVFERETDKLSSCGMQTDDGKLEVVPDVEAMTVLEGLRAVYSCGLCRRIWEERSPWRLHQGKAVREPRAHVEILITQADARRYREDRRREARALIHDPRRGVRKAARRELSRLSRRRRRETRADAGSSGVAGVSQVSGLRGVS